MLPADALRTCESDLSVLETVVTAQPGPAGSLPLEPADLLERPSGDLFGWTLNAGMGWEPARLRPAGVLILSTQGGIRAPRRHARSRSAITPATGRSGC